MANRNRKPRMTEMDRKERQLEAQKKLLDNWKPKTKLGKLVKQKKTIDIDEVLNSNQKILEQEIIDILLPNFETELLAIGQSKGKFGGGKKSIWKTTQKKTSEGNKPKFSALVVVGNKDGYVGIGSGKSKETVPAREKAIRKAKLSLIKIRRGCGSWACGCGEPHTIPLKISGKCSSVKIELMPAPKGTGLCVEKEVRKVLALAGIKDVYSKSYGHTKTKMNLIYAAFDALKKLNKVKIKQDYYKKSGLSEGRLNNVK